MCYTVIFYQNKLCAVLVLHQTALLYSESSDGNRSHALIFIHGVGIQSDVWQPQIEYFSKTYRVIVYDLLGHGESPVQKKTTLDDYVKQLYLLSKKLHLSSFSLIGHSMGAMIAVAFALKYPNEIKSLVAMNMVFNRSEQASKEVLQRADQSFDKLK